MITKSSTEYLTKNRTKIFSHHQEPRLFTSAQDPAFHGTLRCLFAALFLMLILAFGAGTAEADTIDAANTWAGFQEQLNNAREGDVFCLTTDLQAGENDKVLRIECYCSITIDLNNHTIDRGLSEAWGEDGSAIVIEAGSDVTITDSSYSGMGKITGGYAIMGGGICNYGDLHLKGGWIRDNKAEGFGGNIANLGTLTIEYGKNENSYINSGEAQMGGGLYNEISGRVTIKRGVIGYNKASKHGGGIFNSGILNIDGGVIKSNQAGSMGGGIYQSNKGILNLNGGEITKNTVNQGNGGGIYLLSDSVLNFYGGIISENTASNSGGGILAYSGSKVNVKGEVYVTDNSANIHGHNLFLGSGALNIAGELSKFTRIGLYSEDSAKVFTSGNKGRGKAVNYVSDDDSYGFYVNSNGEISSDTPWKALQLGLDCASDGDVITLNKDLKAGNGDQQLCLQTGKNVTLNLYGHTIDRNLSQNVSDNNCIYYGGLLWVCKNSTLHIISEGPTIAITDYRGTLKNAAHLNNGGALFVEEGSTLYLDNLLITNCRSHYNGGAIYNAGTLFMNNCIVNGCMAERYHGGGVSCAENASAELKKTEISGNRAKYGGGFFSVSSHEVTISNCIFKNNQTNSGCGGGLLIDAPGSVLADGCTVSGNKSLNGSGGGGVYLNGGKIIFKGDTEISGNETSASTGGGIFAENSGSVDASSAVLTVKDNLSNGSGSGIYMSSQTSLILGDASITGNGKDSSQNSGLVLCGKTTAKMSGTIVIADNKNSDCLIGADVVLQITGKLGEGSSIAYSSEKEPSKTSCVKITQGLSTNGSPEMFLYSGDKYHQTSLDGEVIVYTEATVRYETGCEGVTIPDDAAVGGGKYVLKGLADDGMPISDGNGNMIKGWTIGNDTETVYALGDTVRVQGDITAKAVWTAYTKYIFTDPEGGNTDFTARLLQYSTYLLPTAEEIGFTLPEGKALYGWKSGKLIYKPGEEMHVRFDKTLEAIWDNQHTVTLKDSRSDVTADVKAFERDGFNMPDIDDIAPFGFKIPVSQDLLFWKAEDAASYRVGQNIPITGNISLTTVWGKTDHVHDGITFTIWDKADSLPDQPGSYYLTRNVLLSDEWTVPAGGVDLCLNGKSITQNGEDLSILTVPSGAVLNLYDEYNRGKLTGSVSIANGAGVYVSGTFNMYGGTITGNKSEMLGSAVFVQSGGMFTMEDGFITDNTGEIGTVVVNTKASFKMNGGEISDNRYGYSGGGVYVVGSFVMNGGSIENNKNIDIGEYGGGVYVSDGGSFEMNAGSVSMNRSSYGGGVYLEENTSFAMNGGVISDNEGESTCGGVYVNGKNVLLSLSGKCKIIDNVSGINYDDSNVLLDASFTYFDITDKLSEDTRIGITETTLSTMAFTDGLEGKGGSSNFISDNTDYGVGLNNSGDAYLAEMGIIYLGDGGEDVCILQWPNGTNYTLPDYTDVGFTAPEGKSFAGWKNDYTNVVKAAGSRVKLEDSILSFTAQWTPTVYSITIAETENGEVSSDKENACMDEIVTLTPLPAEGYRLEEWAVRDSSGTIIAVGEDNTFVMPASNVTVSAVFDKIPADLGDLLVGHSLSLEGDIGVNFYMTLKEQVIADQDTAYMKFIVTSGDRTAEQRVLVRDARKVSVEDETCYVFKCRVSAKEMTAKITAQIIDGDLAGEKYVYSVKEYADYMLAHTEIEAYAKAAPLIRALLNYGAYSQIYFDHNPESLANADLTEEEKTLPEVTVDVAAPVVSGLPEGTALAGTTLSLKSETSLSFYFTGSGKLSFASGDGYTVETETSGQYQVARIRGIAAHHIGDIFTLKVNETGSISYSPLNYCAQVVNEGMGEEKLKDVMKAFWCYWKAADEYARS